VRSDADTPKSKMHKKLCLSAANRVLEVQQVILNFSARNDAGFSAWESPNRLR